MKWNEYTAKPECLLPCVQVWVCWAALLPRPSRKNSSLCLEGLAHEILNNGRTTYGGTMALSKYYANGVIIKTYADFTVYT